MQASALAPALISACILQHKAASNDPDGTAVAEAAADRNGAASAVAELAEAEQAVAPKQDVHAAANANSDCDSDVVIVEGEKNGDSACSSHSGFYRASRETGRANILLVVQVGLHIGSLHLR